MTRTALLLVNENARDGRMDIDVIRNALIDSGLNLIEPSVEQAIDISTVIRDHCHRANLVIIGGGDGTLHHAMEGIVDSKLPLGILPLGTANDLARTLNLPTDPIKACEVILRGQSTKIDLGQVNGKFFCNVASIGLAVNVAERLKQESKSRWGVFAYALAAMKSLGDSRPFHAEIEGDAGRFSVRTRQVTVGNGRSYGGGLTVDESATASDGTLHLFSLEVERWWHIIPLIPALWRGRLRSESNVRTLRGGQFNITTPAKPRPLTADGEFVCSTPASFRCFPRAVEVFVPHVERNVEHW
jgi:diacylglycerol kinase (ATP)